MAGIQLLGKVGPQSLSDGSEAPPRLAGAGEVVIQQASGRFREAVLRGGVFAATIGVAGIDHGAAVDTTALFALYNPVNSGRRLVVLRASLAYVSGTLGAGVVFYGYGGPNAVLPTGGTALTPLPALLGSGNAPVAKAFAGSTLAAAPTPVLPFCSLTALLASTAVAPYVVNDELDGALIVDEGSILALDAVGAAGSTPKVAAAVMWEEILV